MNKFVIDAYAWVEYFKGTTLGESVKQIVEDSNNEIFTNVITISELANHFRKENNNFAEAKKILLSLSSIFFIDVAFAEEVGTFHADIKKERKHLSLADSFVLFTSKKLSAKIVTGDEDFRGLKEVVMIK